MFVADLSGLVGMAKKEESLSVMDVEEGEISDSASVEEISAEDFVKPEVKVLKSEPQQRVWTMRDLYKYQNKYQTSSNYASGLYNFAWAQAVQNKPLDEILVMDFKSTEENNSGLKQSGSSNSMNDDKVVIDVSGDEEIGDSEKEEGELEEGEIDLDLDSGNEDGLEKNELSEKESELEKKVGAIRQGLEKLTVNDVENSYGEVYGRLQNSLDTLGELVLGNHIPNKDALIKLALSAIQNVHSVFGSMSENNKEENRGLLSRLLAHVINQKPTLFSPEQLKEIEVMIPSLDKEKEIHVVAEWVNRNHSDTSAKTTNQVFTSLENRVLDSASVETLTQNNPRMLLESLKSGLASSKARGSLLPLLDLHKDHDADSLPSPTREAPPVLFRGALETGNPVMHHPYGTEALKAVSFYQQKFGRSSVLMSDRLPSPTPSEDGDDGDNDTSGEVSSSSVIYNVKSTNASILARPIVSSMMPMDVSSGQTLLNARNTVPISSGSNSILRTSARSRDPRLRFANSESLSVVNNEPKTDPFVGITNSRKQKNVEEESVLNGPSPKRQRNELTDYGFVRDVQPVSGTGGWLEDRGTVGLQVTSRNHVVENKGGDPRKLENAVTSSGNRSHVVENKASDPRKLENAVSSSGTSSGISTIMNGNEHPQVTDANTTASLHSLLKDIVVNPTMWMNIIKMQQQNSVDPAKSTTQQPPSLNSILGAVPAMNVAPINPLVPGQKSAGILQTPQTSSLDESTGKIRMKPRDPRRVLHSKSSLKSESLGSDQSNTNTSSAQGKGNLNPPKQEDQSIKMPVVSQSTTPPDITRQFTKSLKNIADIMSLPQSSQAEPTVPQIPSSQPPSSQPPSQSGQVHPSWVGRKEVVSESGLFQSGSNSVSEEVPAIRSKPQNTWGEVEHLFEGFDDKQRAAIQRERARRIEEQNKMFASRKLCLVLDLDHTLLNSAKFVEIDPAHDELLRKKEEQDREKPQRHLFRFPHMAMWTKLRPGIWNFLEKASKLYELHLYTMGNKLYATEMAKVLDPKGVLFSGRVISKGDDGDLVDGKSKDLEGVLGMESAVVIIDDSIRVWPHNKLNLIVVERYIYFPCSRRQFGLPGPSLLEIDHDERAEDGTLASSLAVIERIHSDFFLHKSLDEADVRNILASEQQKILAGCRILFSRVFPVGEANPHLHPLWQTAEQFGAVCTNQIDEQVTHVVANSLGTDKVNWALSTGRFVVHPSWVEASALLYRRVNEQDFAIKS